MSAKKNRFIFGLNLVQLDVASYGIENGGTSYILDERQETINLFSHPILIEKKNLLACNSDGILYYFGTNNRCEKHPMIGSNIRYIVPTSSELKETPIVVGITAVTDLEEKNDFGSSLDKIYHSVL